MKPKTVGRAEWTDPHPGPAGTGALSVYQHNGLLAGTRLWTLDGEMPVEYLSPGDRIITRDVGMAVLRDLRVIDAEGETVRISAGSLGHCRPDEDMILPATQRILVRDWRARALFGMDQVLVPVARVVDGKFVTKGPREPLRLVQLLFDAPRILYADGLEVESAAAAVTEIA